MVAARTTDDEFIRMFKELGSPQRMAEALGVNVRSIYHRRNNIEKAHGVPLVAHGAPHNHRGDADTQPNDYLQRVPVDGFSGSVVVFSDSHYWKGQPPSTAHRALIEVIREIKPKLVIANGDIFDGARISRFPRSGWENLPRISEELEEATERMAEVRHAAGRARLLRTIGNHDIRFDRYLAVNASEMEGMQGFRLADHLRAWSECMSVAINNATMVKHRINGGIHSGYRNTLHAGWNTVTGHTHLLDAKFHADYNGPRWGVSGGCIAEVDAPQFAYAEDNPRSWCSGFPVLTYDKRGRLLEPEICRVMYGAAYFRGQVVISAPARKAA